MTDRTLLVYPKKAQKLLGVGTTKFYDLKKDPKFPKPIYVSKRPMYSTEQLENWVKNLSGGV